MSAKESSVSRLVLWAPPLLIVGAGIVAGWNTRNAMSDDAYILLRVVRHWLEGNGPYYNPGLPPVQVVTSPLNLLLIALVAFVSSLFGAPTSDAPVIAAKALHVGWTPLLLLSVYLLLLGRRRTAGAMLGAAIGGTVALFPAVYFTSGMETAMAITLVCFALVAFQAERWTLCSVLLGLAFLARHDALLLVILLALLRAVREQPEERVGAGIRFLKPFVLVVVPWFVASLILYQTATPDTLAAKMAQGGTPYWPEAYYTGLTIYYTWFSAAKPVWVLLVLAVIGFIVSWRSRSGWAMGVWLFVLYQVLHLVAYSALGVPRYHWYYVGYGVGLGLMVGAALSVVKLPVGSAWLACAPPALTLYLAWGRLTGPWNDDHVRYPYYRAVGEYLSQHPPKRSVGLMEIGIIGYYAPNVTVFDFGGIATPDQRNRIARIEANAWLNTDEAPDKVVIRSERHPLEPDSHPDFEKFYFLETTFQGGEAFKRGLQVWSRRADET